MDNLSRPAFLFLGLVVEAGFWEGIGRALAGANIPHSAEQLGQTFAVFVLYLCSQAFQYWRTRHAVRTQVRVAVARHLGQPVENLGRITKTLRRARRKKDAV